MISWWNVNLCPEASEHVAQAVQDRHVSMGKLAQRFEEKMAEILGVSHVVSCGSGTQALMLALLEANIGPGDEVIVPDRTWIATAHAVYLLGARPILVDTQPDAPLMSPQAFAAAISPKTKAVIPVHLNGRECSSEILHIAQNHGIAVIDDATQALFCPSRLGGYIGTHAQCGCFSLSIAKLIPAGQGGFIVTNDAQRANRLRLMRVHGSGNVIEACWQLPGGNFRFTDLHAAVALAQLEHRKEIIDNVRRVYNFYAEHIIDSTALQLLRYDDYPEAIPLYPEVISSNQRKLHDSLIAKGIEARKAYPALHLAPHFGQTRQAFPHADYWGQSLMLPAGPNRTPDELEQVIAALQLWQQETSNA